MVVKVFSAVSTVSSFEADDDTGDLVGMDEKTHTHTPDSMLRCAIFSAQLDLERKQSTAALSKQK